jgi:hypothetical protein
VNTALRIEPAPVTPLDVDYRWDPDTDILSACVRDTSLASTPSGDSVEIEGSDGSWLVLDVAAGRIHGVEVAVWPSVRRRDRLAPPADVADALVRIPAAPGPIAALEVATRLGAEADAAERTFHFTLGKSRSARTVRIARDILLDLDARDRLAGVWLLGVPPFPADS